MTKSINKKEEITWEICKLQGKKEEILFMFCYETVYDILFFNVQI
jgi:hypothetical protein